MKAFSPSATTGTTILFVCSFTTPFSITLLCSGSESRSKFGGLELECSVSKTEHRAQSTICEHPSPQNHFLLLPHCICKMLYISRAIRLGIYRLPRKFATSFTRNVGASHHSVFVDTGSPCICSCCRHMVHAHFWPFGNVPVAPSPP